MLVVDTSGVLAAKDEAHPQHRAVANVILASEELLVSPFVVAECDYMLATRLGVDAAREFLEEVARDAFELVDIDRYWDLRLGVTDASLVVIAARYQTTRLLTLDERHFRAVAPLWGAPAFTLLPLDS